MTTRDIITIGGSAGSIEAVRGIVRQLPVDFPAAIFVVIHMTPRGRSFLPDVLMTDGGLPVTQAIEGERIEPGHVYVAPPDRHLIVAENHIHLTRGPKEGLHRPSINVTFRSAALTYGPRVIGILLSGMLDDGASGLWEIANRHGITIVQDPSEAQFPSMPLNALRDAAVNYRLAASAIGKLLPRLVNEEQMPQNEDDISPEDREDRFSGFTCPECRGPLFESAAPGPVEFRCRVGHLWSLKTLVDEHTSTQERKLYEAIVALEEGADLALYTANRVEGQQQSSLRREAEQLRHYAGAIRKILEERDMPGL